MSIPLPNKSFNDHYNDNRVDEETYYSDLSEEELKALLVTTQLSLISSKEDTHIILKERIKANILLEMVMREDKRGLSHRWFAPLALLTDRNRARVEKAREATLVKCISRFGTKQENVK